MSFISRALAVGSGLFTLFASFVFMLAITRRLPSDELADLTKINATFAIANAVLGFVVVWYPRLLAKDKDIFPDLMDISLLFP